MHSQHVQYHSLLHLLPLSAHCSHCCKIYEHSIGMMVFGSAVPPLRETIRQSDIGDISHVLRVPVYPVVLLKS